MQNEQIKAQIENIAVRGWKIDSLIVITASAKVATHSINEIT